MSLFQKLVERIPDVTKKYVNRQVGFATTMSEKLKDTGMTQRELAEKIGKKESYISRVLSGNANPTLKTIAELEVALGEDVISFNFQLRKANATPVIMLAEPFCFDLIGKTESNKAA